MGLYKKFHPEVFQGHLRKEKYFEGWFLKHCSADQENVFSIIPGIALNLEDSHAFIQIIDGISGETHYISYPVEEFQWDRKNFNIQIGPSSFSLEGISLNISNESMELSGTLKYSNPVRYPGSLLSPGIMGWYSFVPFMECYHGIVSANHDLLGVLNFNHQGVDFSGGKGYIEKDWGTSFPEAWIWIQCNHFTTKEASLFISVAKIPWMGKYFIGFIAFLYLDGKYHQFSTYNHAKISRLSFNGEELNLEMKLKSYSLKARIIKNSSGELRAPETGNMSRRIKESNDSVVEVTLSEGNKPALFQETGQRAGLEIVESIFDYF